MLRAKLIRYRFTASAAASLVKHVMGDVKFYLRQFNLLMGVKSLKLFKPFAATAAPPRLKSMHFRWLKHLLPVTSMAFLPAALFF